MGRDSSAKLGGIRDYGAGEEAQDRRSTNHWCHGRHPQRETIAPSALPEEWRRRSREMEELGATPQARTLEWCASELEQAQREWELKELTLQEAEAESGYSYSALQKMVAGGQLENVGDKGSPKVRRRDLPRRPRSAAASRFEEPDLAEELLAGAR